ncbi:MAG TPA: NAD-dependent epimerase/dehydratase family protein [Terriglobales bacterium]|nr:NAD-dependent epimerase/dehydratase family protein [Terriglobales bacterium]
MKILLIGGTGFIGPHVVRELSRQGHQVAVLHRGGRTAELPKGVQTFIGDRSTLPQNAAVRRFAPEIVVDMILSSAPQAQALMNTFRGVAKRVVAISSMDVYRAMGLVHGTESGPLQPLPLTETSELRSTPHPYSPEALKMMRKIFDWADDDYDKIPVERAVLSDPQLPGTVLRLPAVHGPGDPLHRFFPYLKRMDDRRPKIIFWDELAAWRWSRGYVGNVAAAISLAATADAAAGQIYNVCEEPALSELEWAKEITAVVGWKGDFVLLPRERTPQHLLLLRRADQHWVASSHKIRKHLGYLDHVPVERAVQLTVEWERAHPPQIDPRQFDYAAEDAALATP